MVEKDMNEHLVKAVWMGLTIDSIEDRESFYDAFEKQGMHRPYIIDEWKTLPSYGMKDTGGRSDVLVGFHHDDIPKLAIHPWHLGWDGPRFSWIYDYFSNNGDIIPEDIKKKYFKK